MPADRSSLRANSGVPAELFVEVCTALQRADEELAQLQDSEFWWPLPDRIVTALDIGETLAKAFERLYERTTDEGRRKIDDMIAREAGAIHPYGYEHQQVPVNPEVRKALDEARELVRRRALADPAVEDALRAVENRGWAW